MPIEMIDVPMKVWDGVHEKWTDALEIGWTLGLWYPCDLCKYMKATYGVDVCHLCPLNENSWCSNGRSQASRINVRHHCYNEKAWNDDIRLFLKYIQPYCSDEYIKSLLGDI